MTDREMTVRQAQGGTLDEQSRAAQVDLIVAFAGGPAAALEDWEDRLIELLGHVECLYDEAEEKGTPPPSSDDDAGRPARPGETVHVMPLVATNGHASVTDFGEIPRKGPQGRVDWTDLIAQTLELGIHFRVPFDNPGSRDSQLSALRNKHPEVSAEPARDDDGARFIIVRPLPQDAPVP